MIEILQLDSNFKKPFIITKQFNDCRALMDTGADFPMWVGSKKALISIGGKSNDLKVSFNGFGGKAYADVYTLTVHVGNIIYPNMHLLFYPMESISAHFIFSATMFNGMVYTIDDRNHTFIIDTQSNQIAYNLKLKSKNGETIILSSSCEPIM